MDPKADRKTALLHAVIRSLRGKLVKANARIRELEHEMEQMASRWRAL